MLTYEKELSIARNIAVKAGSVHLAYRHERKEIQKKDDLSPVTAVDRECEALIREAILNVFPRDGFMGEELGTHKGDSGRTWIVDPLDGTRPYIRDIPTHSVLIALEEEAVPVAGVIHLPALNETYWAIRGGGAFLNDTQIYVSEIPTLDKAMGSALGFIEMDMSVKADKVIALMKRCSYMYGFMDAYSYGCIAAGRLDFCVNLLDKAWDCAAAACIVTEAGGRYSDVEGNVTIHNGSFVLSNGVLHDRIVDFLNAG